MYKKIELFGSPESEINAGESKNQNFPLNIGYMWVKNTTDITFPTDVTTKPVWNDNTIALARFTKALSASSYEGTNDDFSKFKIYRKDKNKTDLKYIATIDNDIKKIKDYTNYATNECQYFIYPFKDNGTMSSYIETDKITPKFRKWSIAPLSTLLEDNLYIVDVDNIWSFWLSPEISSFQQVTKKDDKIGFDRYPKKRYSNVNYTTGTMKFLLGDLSCSNYEYSNDSVDKKNKWLEFANSPIPKILTDPSGECMLVDITPTEAEVKYELLGMPRIISFSFTQIGDINKISAYCEVSD